MNATVTLSVDTLALAHQMLLVHLKVDPTVRADLSLRRQFRAAELDLRRARGEAAESLRKGARVI